MSILNGGRKLLLVAFFFHFFSEAPAAAQGLLAHWSFDSSQGYTYYDVSGNGCNASARSSGSGVTLVNGVKGKAINCSGSNSDLMVSNASAFCRDTIVIEAWYNPKTLSGPQGIFSYVTITGVADFGYLMYMTGGRLAFKFVSAASNKVWITVTSPNSLVANAWHHLVCSFDGKTARVYVNGTLEASSPDSQAMRCAASTETYIGGEQMENGGITNRARGKIDELKVYGRILPEDTIAAHCKQFWPIPVLIPVTPSPTYNAKPALGWYRVNNALEYVVKVSPDPFFASTVISTSVSDTFFVPTSDLPAGTYYWRVGSSTDTVFWSTTDSYFTIQETTVPMPVLYGPDTTNNRRPLLSWKNVDDTASYSIQIDTTLSFTAPLIQSVTADTFFSPTIDLPARGIYWRVKSTLVDRYSATALFVIVNYRPELISVSPDTHYIRKPLLKWHSAPSASSYRLQIDTIGNFLNPIYNLLTGDTFYVPTANLPFGKIYWRVNTDIPGSVFSCVDMFWILSTTKARFGITPTTGKGVFGWSSQPGRGVEITYHVEKTCQISLCIFSLTGQCIASFFEGSLAPGMHQSVWRGNDAHGKAAPRGAYIIVLHIDRKTAIQKIILVQ
jgi:hypothetical protein